MNFNEYILEELNNLKPQNNHEAKVDIADLIFKFLMSKKFRKYAVSPEYQNYIKQSVNKSISAGEPIKSTWPFGGYKLWRLAEAPEVDWAELFSLIYFTKWLKPVSEIYQPGVWLDFYSDDIVVEMMNNIPQSETNAYTKSFKELISFIENYIPQNIKFTYNRVAEQYKNTEEFKQELNQIMSTLKEEMKNIPLSSKQITMIDLNVKLLPEQDNDVYWREKIHLIHESYLKTSKKRPYYRDGWKILVFSNPIPDSIAVGTTKRSIAKFWVGVGVAQKNNNDYSVSILSPKQLEAKNFATENINIEGLDGKNFKSIRIISSLD